MTVRTTSGAKLYIGPQVADTVNTTGAFSPLTYVEVGDLGDESPLVNFSAIGDNRVKKAKGARDAGTITVVCGRDPTDAGQLAMQAAEQTSFNYAIKIVLNDMYTTSQTSGTIFYFRGMLSSQRNNMGSNDSITKRTFNIAVNSQVFVIAPA